jgi:hypothetical protein
VYDKNPDGSITEPPRITLSREYATRKMSGQVAGVTDMTSTRVRRNNMRHSAANDKAIAAFENCSYIKPILDKSTTNCTRCCAVICEDCEIRCVDCIDKRKRKNQFLFAGGWSVTEEQENEHFAQQEAEQAKAEAAAEQVKEISDKLREQMADTTADEKDQHAALKDTLKIMGAHQWHETTCKRGKDVKCACVFGRARNMRNELEAKIKLTNAGGICWVSPNTQ